MKTSHPRRLLSLVFFLFLQATVALAQGKQVTISLRNATLKQVITAIEKQTPYNISYRSGLFDNKDDIDIDVRNASVKEVLTRALKSRNLDFEIISDKSIVIKEKQRRNPQHEGGQKDDGQKRKYTGLVTDESGEPIIGATLTCNGKALGVTDVDGRFNIKAYEGQKLTVTFIGMADETVKLGFAHKGPIAVTQQTVSPEFIPYEWHGRIHHRVVYVQEVQTRLWYITNLLVSGTPRTEGRAQDSSRQAWRMEVEVHSLDASPVNRLDAALYAVSGALDAPEAGGRSFVITDLEEEQPDVKEVTN